MARMVASAFVQEIVSRVTSYLFSKLDDKVEASRGHYAERLEMVHTELELALERSARMPITDVSLLRSCLVAPQNAKFFKIFYYIEFLDACMKH